jgi:hypothetical protein
VGDRQVESSSQNVFAFDGATRPGSAVESCRFIDIARQRAAERRIIEIGCSIKIDALDARGDAIFEPINRGKIAWQVMTERLFNLLAALERVKFPDTPVCDVTCLRQSSYIS